MTAGKLRASIRIKILLMIITVGVIVILFPRGEAIESEVTVGNIWIQDDLIADFSFPILKSEEVYLAEIENAKDGVYWIFEENKQIANRLVDSMNRYNNYLTSVIDSNLASGDSADIVPTFLSQRSFQQLKAERLEERQSFRRSGHSYSELFDYAERILRKVYDKGILNENYNAIKHDSIALRSGSYDDILPKMSFLEPLLARELVYDELDRLNINLKTLRALHEYIIHFLEPNIEYRKTLTDEEILLAVDKVSRNIGLVTENERIVAKHDPITPEIRQKIESYKLARGAGLGWEEQFLQYVGKVLHIFSLLLLLSIYFYNFRKKIWEDNLKLSIFVILFIWMSYLTYLSNQLTFYDSIHLLIFIPAASMLLTIIFDSRVGFYGTIILSLICGGLRGNDYSFVMMNVFAGSIAVYTVRDIQNRTQIFRSFIFIFLAYASTILFFGMESFAPWDDTLTQLVFASVNALVSPVLVYGLLIFFEKFFKITTDLTLLELSNFDRPLLRELARKAPGTFSHSVTMGTIAESAAEAVKANPLLARVGAYYHDVGKTITPQYFVENQLDQKNRHDALAPKESVNLIFDHVKKGITLAKEYKLPQEIIDFIPTHHGESVITFFYEKAKEKYGEDKVSKNDYRYPGPKPFTKETGIVMLADSCESAARSVDDANPEKIENLISNLINSKIEDNQLDDTPLTFADITKIKKTFITILLGQSHRRIRYPKQEKMEDTNDKDEKEA